jgi:hypothetical protein
MVLGNAERRGRTQTQVSMGLRALLACQVTFVTQTGNWRAYQVDVEGRLSLCDAWFGHQGMYPTKLIVDRIYSLRSLVVGSR